MWAQATTFFTKVKDGITTLADQQYKEFTTELKRNDALKREKKRQEELRKKVIPPWVALDESKAILEAPLKEKVLQLSKEERTFLVPAPEEVFDFELVAALPYIQGALQADPELNKIRYRLVPKKLSEEVFFRNYFYRVSVLREHQKMEPLPLSDTALMSEEATGFSNAVAMDAIKSKKDPDDKSSPSQFGSKAEETTEVKKTEEKGDAEAKDDTLDEPKNTTEFKIKSPKQVIQEDDDDVGLDSEFITDDFVNIGMKAKRDEEVDSADITIDGDLDLKTLESMVEAIENSNELP
mmetsp:Transcript_1834/g.3527  ORF Transcript_1834/g.3527 Transcript_1834/m.3527 type:complete len:295 (-) Transcript_1834:192-1076(-)